MKTKKFKKEDERKYCCYPNCGREIATYEDYCVEHAMLAEFISTVMINIERESEIRRENRRRNLNY